MKIYRIKHGSLCVLFLEWGYNVVFFLPSPNNAIWFEKNGLKNGHTLYNNNSAFVLISLWPQWKPLKSGGEATTAEHFSQATWVIAIVSQQKGGCSSGNVCTFFWYLRISFWLEKQLGPRHRQMSSVQENGISYLGKKTHEPPFGRL